jgi:PAS domain S-box-containing protein
LALAAGAVTVRLAAGARFDGLLIAAAVFSAVVVALRLQANPRLATEAAPVVEPLKELLDSAGPMVVGIGLDGKFTYVNPSTERILGYHAAELMVVSSTSDLLAPGEGARLVAEMQKLSGIHKPAAAAENERLADYMECVQTLPPSQVPSFDAQLRRKDGALLPVTLHVSALRGGSGTIEGLVVMALDQSATLRQEQALRESQERYRDLFENSVEMIATLSPAGKFLYANPAWSRFFNQDSSSLLALESFEKLFDPSCRGEVAALFRRALDGEAVNRTPLRHHTTDGRVMELELSLSQRRKAGNPLAVRCLLRDVTQQTQREHRLALQLAVSQIVGESASPEAAAPRILEALCVSQGWDAAFKWEVNSEENRLEFCSAWGVPERRTEALIQQSMGLKLAGGKSLPGRVWMEERPVWIADLASMPHCTTEWFPAGRCRCAPAKKCWRCWSSIAICACARTAKPWQ